MLAERFEEHRRHLRGVAVRMLGSVHAADDAVHEAWLRLSRSDTRDVANLRGSLTTATGRVCLDILRSRAFRREDPLDWHVPDPIVTQPGSGVDPEQEALLAESVVSRCTHGLVQALDAPVASGRIVAGFFIRACIIWGSVGLTSSPLGRMKSTEGSSGLRL